MYTSFVYYFFKILLLVQAEITEEVVDVIENETNPIIFRCKATGKPIPTIDWYFNGILINVSKSNNYNISNSLNGAVVTSSLAIVNAQSSNVGTYTCHAENIIGSDRSSAVLTVNGNCGSYILHCSYIY